MAPSGEQRAFREQFAALRNLPPFLALVWRTQPALALANLLLRLVKSLLLVLQYKHQAGEGRLTR